MKYAGNITILDDEGETVFERELSDDEIVEVILATLKEVPTEDESTEGPKRKPAGHVAAGVRTCCGAKEKSRHKKGCSEAGTKPFAAPTDDNEEFRPCCGSSTRGRHKKGCVNAGITQDPGARRTVSNRTPFSEPTFNVVKTLLEEYSVDMVSSEKGLELDEVRRANLADDFDDYLTIA